MRKPPAVYADIADLEEDDRIDMIGRKVEEQKLTVAFITDADPGKADRYIQKLLTRFPGIEVIGRWPGPVANTISVKVGPKT
jgi:hypothetical protein